MNSELYYRHWALDDLRIVRARKTHNIIREFVTARRVDAGAARGTGKGR